VLTNRKAYIPTRRQKNAPDGPLTLFEQILGEGREAFSPASLPGEQKQPASNQKAGGVHPIQRE
jgi:hypothetical protein